MLGIDLIAIERSTITQPKEEFESYRAVVPLKKIVRAHKLEKRLETHLHFYSYEIKVIEDADTSRKNSSRLDKIKKVLILTVPKLKPEEIVTLNDLFGTGVVVQYFTDIRVYVYISEKEAKYIMNLKPEILSFLDARNYIHWAEFEVNKKKYLLIRGDLTII